MKYHLSPDGKIRPCRAYKVPCKYRSFPNKEKAVVFYNKSELIRPDYDNIVSKESEITALLTDNGKNVDKFVGIENRVKSFGRTVEKCCRNDISDVYTLNDIIRYTEITDTDSYVENLDSTLCKLSEKGIKLEKERNAWVEPEGSYKGLNLKLITEEGVRFELQIHTKESYEAKQVAHDLYEALQSQNKTVKELESIKMEMATLFVLVEYPKNFEEINGVLNKWKNQEV